MIHCLSGNPIRRSGRSSALPYPPIWESDYIIPQFYKIFTLKIKLVLVLGSTLEYCGLDILFARFACIALHCKSELDDEQLAVIFLVSSDKSEHYKKQRSKAVAPLSAF